MLPDDSEERVREARELLKECTICPRECKVDRTAGKTGYCGVDERVVVSSAGPHFGEEAPLVGIGGSGTIFLAGCNLLCLYCQNYDISHGLAGTVASTSDIVRMMLRLESIGCHNINFVTPTHCTPQLMEAILVARQEGLTVPIVYNCGGYEKVETLKLLDGFVQIYMPDFKYADSEPAKKYSSASDYPEVARRALKEMHRQVGDLLIEGGVAKSGLLVRHLVLPNREAGSKAVIDFLADEISPNTYVNVMRQYRPLYRACECPEINRYPTTDEFYEAYDYARSRGLRLAR